MRRQCTTEYKVRQIQAKVKQLQGKGKNDRYDRYMNFVGISLEEMKRVSRPEIAKEIRVFPFCNYVTMATTSKHIEGKYFEGHGISRGKILYWLKDNGYPDPGKSSCAFCPYMSNREWKQIKRDNKIWEKVVQVDRSIRNRSRNGVNQRIYLHRSLKPIDTADLQENQLDLLDECEGFCHI